ncbi:MAG: hypothetical protein IKW86_04395 [Salinivirgaceae bacterium]|nr:hypothetical protein [Salinivirgaceae bacterium]
MSFDVLEKTYKTLTEQQQLMVYDLALSLYKLNMTPKNKPTTKRVFGKFSKTAKAHFSDNWEMTEEEMCIL